MARQVYSSSFWVAETQKLRPGEVDHEQVVFSDLECGWNGELVRGYPAHISGYSDINSRFTYEGLVWLFVSNLVVKGPAAAAIWTVDMLLLTLAADNLSMEKDKANIANL